MSQFKTQHLCADQTTLCCRTTFGPVLLWSSQYLRTQKVKEKLTPKLENKSVSSLTAVDGKGMIALETFKLFFKIMDFILIKEPVLFLFLIEL